MDLYLGAMDATAISLRPAYGSGLEDYVALGFGQYDFNRISNFFDFLNNGASE